MKPNKHPIMECPYCKKTYSASYHIRDCIHSSIPFECPMCKETITDPYNAISTEYQRLPVFDEFDESWLNSNINSILHKNLYGCPLIKCVVFPLLQKSISEIQQFVRGDNRLKELVEDVLIDTSTYNDDDNPRVVDISIKLRSTEHLFTFPLTLGS